MTRWLGTQWACTGGKGWAWCCMHGMEPVWESCLLPALQGARPRGPWALHGSEEACLVTAERRGLGLHGSRLLLWDNQLRSPMGEWGSCTVTGHRPGHSPPPSAQIPCSGPLVLYKMPQFTHTLEAPIYFDFSLPSRQPCNFPLQWAIKSYKNKLEILTPGYRTSFCFKKFYSSFFYSFYFNNLKLISIVNINTHNCLLSIYLVVTINITKIPC